MGIGASEAGTGPTKTQSGFTLTSWNLLHGMAIPPNSGATLHGALEKLTAELSSDVIAIQEVDLHQNRSGNGNQVKEIAELIGAKYWAFAPSMYGTPGEKWHGVTEEIVFDNSTPIPPDAMYGIGIVSRVPVKRWHRINLGKAPLGAPLLVAGEKRPQLIYVSDEPRSALVAELENGISVTTTHLSFVPLKNLIQLRKIAKWVAQLPGIHIMTGDFNLPWGLAPKISGWRDLVVGPTYPSWKPSLEFDYIMSKELKHEDVIARIHNHFGISDHLASSITIR
jgi:endonuclease/exonuclease/phosphatase family metal-dependent hydrolase